MILSPTLSMSFAGCAWLFPYYLGVLSEFRQTEEYCQTRFLGASSGSIAATAAVLDICPYKVFGIVLDCERESRHRKLGPMGTMTRFVRTGLESVLDEQSWSRLNNRLFISVTRLPRLKNERITGRKIQSNQDLLQAILSSCYIPLYYEKIATFKRRPYIDGGLTDNHPGLDRHTIKVTPHHSVNSEAAHISPRQKFHYRYVLFPKEDILRKLFAEGQENFRTFWKSYKSPFTKKVPGQAHCHHRLSIAAMETKVESLL